MIGRVLPYVAATLTGAGLVVGGLVLTASAESAVMVLPRFPDDPAWAWEVRVEGAEWAVGDEANVYVASPSAVEDQTTITVRDRATGGFVRRFDTKRPAGEFAEFSGVLDGVLLAERCTYEPVVECELIVSDLTGGRTLWAADTSDTAIGLAGRSVVLNAYRDERSELQLLDLRSGDQQASVAGDAVYFEPQRPVVTVRNGLDVEAFRLPDLDQPVVSARLPHVDAAYDVVGDALVVGYGQNLRVNRDEEFEDLPTLSADVESVHAASDVFALVRTDDGVTSAIDVSPQVGRPPTWTSDAEWVASWGGQSGSVVLTYDGESTFGFLDQRTGDPIEDWDPDSWFHFFDGGVVIVEPARVGGFGYDEQNLVWSIWGSTTDSSLHPVDRGFVIIETDGTVRLYQ